MNLGMPELLIVLAIILLLFGSTRLPKLAQGLGKSIKEFKRGVNEGETEEQVDEPRRRERLQATRAEYTDDLAPKRVGVNEPR